MTSTFSEKRLFTSCWTASALTLIVRAMVPTVWRSSGERDLVGGQQGLALPREANHGVDEVDDVLSLVIEYAGHVREVVQQTADLGLNADDG